jgi:tRNA modification GTPase
MVRSLLRLKDYNTKDTIAAIATYPATSALGVIRISGRKTMDIVSRIFLPNKKKDIKKVKSYTLHYGWIVNDSSVTRQDSSAIVDEVLISVMKAPYTYTRENVVEIFSHGGILVLNKILELILKNGARLAKPGEFTYRAFINGRLDLLQAQSVLDIVEAKTEQGLAGGLKQLRGEVSKTLEKIREHLKNIFINLEAYLQFPDEEIEISIEEIGCQITRIKKKIKGLIESSERTDILREGLECVICGKANSGKSTLFNRLLKEERVLVTKVAGTTRDVVEESINIKGIPLKICDTAGILEPKDLIQRKALEKSWQKIQDADIILLLLDYSKPLEKDDFFLLEKLKGKNTIIVVNKIDLNKKIDLRKIRLFRKNLVRLSALKGTNLSGLEDAIFKNVYITKKDDLIFLAQWQKTILKQLYKELSRASHYVEKGYSVDFINFTLKKGLDMLDRLTGKVVDETLLEEIFSNFCIGK